MTGGAGFIGSCLVDRLLAEEWEVDVIDDLSTGSLANLADARSHSQRQLRFHQVDVCSPSTPELIARRHPDVVFHLAAQADVRVSVARPTFDAEVNVVGSVNVLEGARIAGTSKLVYAASGGTLYGEADVIPTPEDAPKRPASPYGASKKAVLDYLDVYMDLYGLEGVGLALANVYGPRQNPHGEAGVVAIFAGLLAEGRSCTIFGDGLQTRDFVYVDDVVDAFVRAATRPCRGLLNIGTGVETSVVELYRMVAEVSGVSLEPRFAPGRAGELRRSALDAGAARRELGWQPWTSLEDGIRAVVEAQRKRSSS